MFYNFTKPAKSLIITLLIVALSHVKLTASDSYKDPCTSKCPLKKIKFEVTSIYAIPPVVLGLVFEHTDQSAIQLMTVCKRWEKAVKGRLNIKGSRFSIEGRLKTLREQALEAIAEHIAAYKVDPDTETGIGKATYYLYIYLDFLDFYSEKLYPEWKKTDWWKEQVYLTLPRLKVIDNDAPLSVILYTYTHIYILENTRRFLSCYGTKHTGKGKDPHRWPAYKVLQDFDNLRTLQAESLICREKVGNLSYRMESRYRLDDTGRFVYEPIYLQYSQIFFDITPKELDDNDYYFCLYNTKTKTSEYRAYALKKIGDHYFLKKKWSEALRAYKSSLCEFSSIYKHLLEADKKTLGKTIYDHQHEYPAAMQYYIIHRDYLSRHRNEFTSWICLSYLWCLSNSLLCYLELNIEGDKKIMLEAFTNGQLLVKDSKGVLQIYKPEVANIDKHLSFKFLDLREISFYETYIIVMHDQDKLKELIETLQPHLRYLLWQTKKNKNLFNQNTYQILAQACREKGMTDYADSFEKLGSPVCVIL